MFCIFVIAFAELPMVSDIEFICNRLDIRVAFIKRPSATIEDDKDEFKKFVSLRMFHASIHFLQTAT
jgi:hypothetical protein